MIMDFKSLTVIQLREKLGTLGLTEVGNKAAMVARLEDHYWPKVNADRGCLQNAFNFKAMKSSNLTSDNLKTWENMSLPKLKVEVAKYGIKVSGGRLREDYLRALRSYFKTDLDKKPDFGHIKNRNIKVVMIAEKPSMGREIAKVLANGQNIREYKASNGKLSVSEFSGSFFGYPADFRISSTFGHVFSDTFHKDVPRYADEALFDADIVKTPCDDNHDMPSALAELANGADALVLWLDCDLEGEAICYEVLDCVRDVITVPPSGDVMDVVFRAHFSSADEATDAMKRLQKPDFRQCLAVRAKHDLDLRIGVALSRYQTSILRRHLKGLDIPMVSYGPCQIPCLTFCVEAQEVVESHRGSYHYYVMVKLTLNGVVVYAKSNLFKDEMEAEECLKRIQHAQKAQVVNVERKHFAQNPPPALNTVSLLKLCSTEIGIGPKDAMQVAENLYTSGLISYPRTETTRYTDQLRVRERRQGIQENLHFIVDDPVNMDWHEAETAPRGGIDVGDHPPIMPTGKTGRLQLHVKEMRVYEIICRHFLASLMPPQRYHSDTVTFSLDGINFSRTVHVIDDMGFAAVIPWGHANVDFAEKVAFTAMKDQLVQIANVWMTQTAAPVPTPLNEAELMDLMEKHRIGTDASIPGHIDNIIKRKYVMVDSKSRQITPTTLGRTLINVYRKCVPQLAQPQMRAQMEMQLVTIARGEHDFEEVRVNVLNAFRVQFKQFKKSFHSFARSFEPCFERCDGCSSRGDGFGPNRNEEVVKILKDPFSQLKQRRPNVASPAPPASNAWHRPLPKSIWDNASASNTAASPARAVWNNSYADRQRFVPPPPPPELRSSTKEKVFDNVLFVAAVCFFVFFFFVILVPSMHRR